MANTGIEIARVNWDEIAKSEEEAADKFDEQAKAGVMDVSAGPAVMVNWHEHQEVKTELAVEQKKNELLMAENEKLKWALLGITNAATEALPELPIHDRIQLQQEIDKVVKLGRELG